MLIWMPALLRPDCDTPAKSGCVTSAAVPANSQSQRAAALAAAAALTKRLQGIGGASTSYRDPRWPAAQAQHFACLHCPHECHLILIL